MNKICNKKPKNMENFQIIHKNFIEIEDVIVFKVCHLYNQIAPTSFIKNNMLLDSDQYEH